MSEFAFVYRKDIEPLSAEQGQQLVAACLDWFKDLMNRGVIQDPGVPLGAGGGAVIGADGLVHDGPFLEAKDIVSGFTLVEAKDLAEAVEIAKTCPIVHFGGKVEVRPVGQLGGCATT